MDRLKRSRGRTLAELRWARGAGVLCGALLLSAALAPRPAQEHEPEPARGGLSERAARLALGMSPLGPVPPDPTNRVADDPRAAHLGQWLFFDAELSADGSVSCATCHDPALEFSDGRALSQGLGEGLRKTPSLWNTAFQEAFFWDGRADTLWAQALQPLEEEHEMGGSRVDMARRVHEHPELRRAFEQLFGPLPDLAERERFPAGARPRRDGKNDARSLAWEAMQPADRAEIERVFVGLGKSLAAYQRKLVRTDSPFDRFVAGLRSGDEQLMAALPNGARRGFELFVGKANCRSCHHGPTFQDGAFHDLMLPGVEGALPDDPGRYGGRLRAEHEPFHAASIHSDDRSGAAARRRASAQEAAADFGAFKTPTLRNVAERGPYMHRGHFMTLEEVVHYYSTLEGAVRAHSHGETVLIALDLDAQEQSDLVAFLRALTGARVDESLFTQPPSPLPHRQDG